MPLQLVKSSKGKDHLVHNGYRYIFDRPGPNENIWVCIEKRNQKCRGRAYSASNEVVRTNDQHNHVPDTAKTEVTAIMSSIKTAAETTSDHPHLFKVTPQLFDQLYTIHISRFNKIIPAVFALLPNRTETTYFKMLCALKDLSPNLKPVSITTDFEKAAKNAFHRAFPEITQSGCLFHFGQCFWRQIQKLPEVACHYVEDADYALKVKCLTALAFVPPPAVKEAFNILISDDFYSSSRDMETLVDYVEDTWIGGNRRGRERPPRFSIEEWNCFQRVTDNLARTNNSVEGWHRAFQSQLGATHPTLWKFIDTIRKQQSLTELEMQQHLAGQSPQPQRRKYRDLTERLKVIVEDYENRPVIEYLTGIAHNIRLNV